MTETKIIKGMSFEGVIRRMSVQNCGFITDETIMQAGMRAEFEDGSSGHMRLFFGTHTETDSLITKDFEDKRVRVSGYMKDTDLRSALFVESCELIS